MIDLDLLGIQSYCFRSLKTHAQVTAALKACGVSTLELCGVHVNFADPAGFAAAIGAYRDAGLRIASIGVQGMANDIAKERLMFEFVRQAGARHMSVNFQPETSPASWRTAEKLAEEYDVLLGIHNHGGRHWLGSAQMLGHVFANTSRRIGLCLDTAWAMAAGEDPIALAERYGERLYAVHLKDFVFDRAGRHQDVVVGAGNLDLPGFLKTLDRLGFSGLLLIEYEGDAGNPVPALKACVQAVRGSASQALTDGRDGRSGT